MPRKPDPETKTQQAYVRGNTETENKKIKAAKEICARNKIDMRDVLLEGIDRFLKKHHWPPGNSQALLSVFGAVVTKECFSCHEMFPKPKLIPVEFISGLRREICPECLRKDEEGRRLVKKRLL